MWMALTGSPGEVPIFSERTVEWGLFESGRGVVRCTVWVYKQTKKKTPWAICQKITRHRRWIQHIHTHILVHIVGVVAHNDGGWSIRSVFYYNTGLLYNCCMCVCVCFVYKRIKIWCQNSSFFSFLFNTIIYQHTSYLCHLIFL